MLKLAILVVVITVVLAAPRPDDGHYKSRADNINVDEVLKNSRLVDNYVKCALGKGKCTPDGQLIKEQLLDLLPEILDTNCGKCTDEQKVKISKVLHFLHDNKHSSFDEIMKNYDPDMKLRTEYKEKYPDSSNDWGVADILD